MMLCRALLIAVGAACLALVGGCGGADPAQVHLKKTEFLRRGEKICTAAETEQFEAAGEYVQHHPHAEEEDLVVGALPPLEREIVKLSALDIPVGDEEKIGAFIEALESAVVRAKENPTVVLASRTDPFTKPNKLARDYGFSVCANNP